MGGSCTKLVTVKTSIHSNAAFHTKVHSIPPPNDAQRVEQSIITQQDEHPCKISVDDGNSKCNESQDLYSIGDHKHCQNKEIIQDKCNVRNADGDYKTEIKVISKTSQNENDVIKGQSTFRLEETEVLEVDNDDKITELNCSSRSTSPVDQADTVSSDRSPQKDTGSNNGFKDLNANSRHGEEREHVEECLPLAIKIEVRSGDGDRDEYDEMKSENDGEKLNDNRDKATSFEKGDQENNGEYQDEEPTLCEVQTLVQDSLFFFPLQTDKPRPVTPHKIPERLQNRPRKPPLSYNERMLLADLNRFEQLDKRREFAVKRNRSIPRNGKLPKIDGTNDDDFEEGSNSHSNIDD